MLRQVNPIPFTYEDYLLFPEDGKRHEIIEGEYYMSPAPMTRHQRISGKLFKAFDNFLEQYSREAVPPLGEVFYAPMDVVLSDLNIVQPDLLFIAASHSAIITEKNIQGPPDLVIEILSESTRKIDERIKRNLYARFGVQEYWIVDPELETVKVYRITDTGYACADTFSRESGEAITTLLLPHFTISLTQIFG